MPQSVFLSIKNWEGVSLFFQEQPGCIAVSNTLFFFLPNTLLKNIPSAVFIVLEPQEAAWTDNAFLGLNTASGKHDRSGSERNPGSSGSAAEGK